MKSDVQLQSDVLDELKSEPLLEEVAPQIGVSCKNGVITLSGKVDTYIHKHAAEVAAQRVKGVSFVAVDIDVTLGLKDKRDDSAIAMAIKESMKHLSILDYESIDVKVDEGVVTLDGILRWNYQREAAEAYVKNIIGVRSINNNIMLTDQPCDEKTIREKINAAFHRNATLDAANIHVDIIGKKAILKGSVRSWVEKKDAETVAWSSPGIKEVVNDIEIKVPYVN